MRSKQNPTLIINSELQILQNLQIKIENLNYFKIIKKPSRKKILIKYFANKNIIINFQI